MNTLQNALGVKTVNAVSLGIHAYIRLVGLGLTVTSSTFSTSLFSGSAAQAVVWYMQWSVRWNNN